MNRRRILTGEDRITEIPKDIQEMILYRTRPEDLNTLCYSSSNMEKLCDNKRIMYEYLSKYGLLYKSDYKFEDHVNEINQTNSKFIIKYAFQHLIENYPDLQNFFMEDFEIILKNVNLTNEDILEILSVIPNTFFNPPILIDLRNLRTLGITLTWSIVNHRPELIEWLKSKDILIYDTAIKSAADSKNITLFYDLLKFMLINKMGLNYKELLVIAVSRPNLGILKILLDVLPSYYKIGGTDNRNLYNYLGGEIGQYIRNQLLASPDEFLSLLESQIGKIPKSWFLKQ